MGDACSTMRNDKCKNEIVRIELVQKAKWRSGSIESCNVSNIYVKHGSLLLKKYG